MKTCGARSREIPDTAKFCPYCGVPVKAAASNFKGPVVIERPRMFSQNTTHLRIAVYADNELAGVLKNGDRTRLSLPLGVHRIGFDSKAYDSFAEYAENTQTYEEIPLTEDVSEVTIAISFRPWTLIPGELQVERVWYSRRGL